MFVDLTLNADIPGYQQYKTLTSALNYINSSLSNATVVLTPGQTITDLTGKIMLYKPMNITFI